jgi:hypothetical protein
MTDFEWTGLIISLVLYAFGESFRIAALPIFAAMISIVLALTHADVEIFVVSLGIFALLAVARGITIYLNQNEGVNDE